MAVKGPKGPKGPEGPKGPKGPKEVLGPKGPKGPGSYLYAKMLGGQAFFPGGGGGRMPQGGPFYSQNELAPLLRWINSDNLAACLP